PAWPGREGALQGLGITDDDQGGPASADSLRLPLAGPRQGPPAEGLHRIGGASSKGLPPLIRRHWTHVRAYLRDAFREANYRVRFTGIWVVGIIFFGFLG